MKKNQTVSFLLLLLFSACIFAAVINVPESIARTASESFESGTQEDINSYIRQNLPVNTRRGSTVTTTFADGSTSQWTIVNMHSTVAAVPIDGTSTLPTPCGRYSAYCGSDKEK